MADRFPLIVDSSALQIKELPSGDNLDLTGNSITGVVNITASGGVSGATGTFTGNVSIGGTLTYEDVTNVDSVGIITAQTGLRIGTGGTVGPASGGIVTYFGDGSQLTGLPQSGVGIKTAGGTVGFGATFFDFRGTGVGEVTTPFSGITTVNITGGGGGGSISTEAASPSNAVVTLDLDDAQDHKLSVTGIVTVTCSGGNEGESHTVRIVNSGIATVGFSTYFLFPSGATPSLPTGSGDISLISFTVHREGSSGIGTQLLAGSSVNFS